jgi:hypothetical protein
LTLLVFLEASKFIWLADMLFVILLAYAKGTEGEALVEALDFEGVAEGTGRPLVGVRGEGEGDKIDSIVGGKLRPPTIGQYVDMRTTGNRCPYSI